MPLLRIVADPTATERILERIDALGLESRALVERAVRADPPGDQILLDIPRSRVDDLVGAMERSGVRDRMDIGLQALEDLVDPDRLGADDSEVVVWAQVRQEVAQQGRLSWVNTLLVVVAGMIAAVGIIQDQVLLVVGAMALSPDYFVVAAPCLAAAWGRWRRVAAGLGAVAVCFAAGAGGAWALTLVLGASGIVTRRAYPSHELLAFITHPDALSVVVALLAGVAGGLAITLSDGRGLVGVFVSVTTIPAAANIGVAAAAGDPAGVGGAAAQLGVNLAALFVAVTATLAARRWWHHRVLRRRPSARRAPRSGMHPGDGRRPAA